MKGARGDRLRLEPAALLGLALGLGFHPGAFAAENPRALSFEVEARIAYPKALSEPQDVRWAGEAALVVLDVKNGALRLPLDLEGDPEILIPIGNAPGEIFHGHRLASSEELVVVAALANAVAWRNLRRNAPVEQVFYAGVMDMDLVGDRIAILGPYRDREGEWIPDGAIVRMGRLSSFPYELESVLISPEGPGASDMTRCGVMPMGGSRFLGDGSLLVVPGVHPGIFLVGPDGTVRTIWDSGEVGITLRCEVSQEESYVLYRDPEARWGWLSKRSTVDGVVPLGQNAGLIVRRPGPDGVRWDLVVLRRDGSFETLVLPVESPSLTAHLRGDTRGDRIVLALSEVSWPGRDRVQEPELIYLRWRDPR